MAACSPAYPAAAAGWPVSQLERIWKIWQKVLNSAIDNFPAIASTPPNLEVNSNTDKIIAVYDPSANKVHIGLNLAQLMSDSESELAFAMAHEIGHSIQRWRGKLIFFPNQEWDADQYGLWLSFIAGYDPYAAAGTLAKIYMAMGQAGLADQNFHDVNTLLTMLGLPVSQPDFHGSFNTRIDLLFKDMQYICSTSQMASLCALYKTAVHPNLPIGAPLSKPGTKTP